MKAPLIVRIFKGNELLEVKQFEQDQIIFGNDGDVHVDLKDALVSSIHCLIELRDSGYYVCDLGSTTGTFRNGKQILDEPVSSGDAIEIGPFRVQFFVGVPKPKSAPGASPVSVATPPPSARATETMTYTPAPAPTSRPAKVNTPPPPKLPDASRMQAVREAPRADSKGNKSGKKHSGTFAPSSEIKDLSTYFRSTKGATLEVIVSWKERVLDTYHFSQGAPRTIGSSRDADVYVPSAFLSGRTPFLDMTGGCRVLATVEMNPYLIQPTGTKSSLDDLVRTGKAARTAVGHSMRLDQGEMICLSISGGTIQIFIRWIPQARVPLLAMPLTLSSSELTALVASLALVILSAIAVSTYKPTIPDEIKEDTLHKAVLVFNKPPPTQPPPPVPSTTVTMPPAPTTTVAPKKIMVTDKPQPKVAPKVAEKPKEVQKVANKAQAVAPNKVVRPQKFGVVQTGGTPKTTDKPAAPAPIKAKDVSKLGLLGSFGAGLNKEIDRSSKGSGTLLGAAANATGASGFNKDRPGEGLGLGTKEAGGQGTAIQGVTGLGTKGRGEGDADYGSDGTSLGGKGNVAIEPGGQEAEFVGTIDREAVRRVIKSIINQIKSCYERELRVNTALEGKIVVRFEIEAQGKVGKTSTLKTTLNNSKVESCVGLRIKEARFPEPPPGTIAVVDFPFVFGAQKN